ncbi:MAG: hypothetical protein EAZ53_13795 [Bacteroidetes bacterium]|nr:MAG: hypothetical protein EAZ53_13795 [Bacteroidota bacterium]
MFIFCCKTTFKFKIFSKSLFYLLPFLGIFFFTIANGQEKTINYTVKNGYSTAKLIPLSTEGCLFFYKTNENNTKQKSKLVIIKLDTALLEMWQTEYPINSNVEYINHCYTNQFLYILFVKESAYEIVQINPLSGETFSLKGYLPYKSCLIEDFTVIDNFAYWGGSLPPSDGKVFFRSAVSFIFFPLMFIPNFIPERTAFATQIDLNSGSSKEYAFNYKGFSTLTDIIKDTTDQKSYFFLKNRSGKSNMLHLQDINSNGIRSKTISINPISKKHQLLTGKFYVSKLGNKMIIGTYSKNKNSGAQGLYFSGLQNGKQSFIEYHSFTKFKKFFNYLSVNQRNRIENRIENKKKSGKDLSLDYQLLIHDVIESNNTFKIVAEAYYATYRTEFRTIWVYGRPVTQAYNVFDGWKYSHAIVACFNSEGKLLWDDWISIPNITSYTLDEKVKVNCNENFTTLTLYQNGEFIVKNIDENNIDKNLDILPDNITSKDAFGSSSMDFWYHSFAISFTKNYKKSENEEGIDEDKIVIKKYNYLKIK